MKEGGEEQEVICLDLEPRFIDAAFSQQDLSDGYRAASMWVGGFTHLPDKPRNPKPAHKHVTHPTVWSPSRIAALITDHSLSALISWGAQEEEVPVLGEAADLREALALW